MYELSTKIKTTETIPIPAKVMKKLSLHNGTFVEGIVEDENVDAVFKEIRKGWKRWQQTSRA
jgi:antitoxin component of MazEF toxin-antitoxin module